MALGSRGRGRGGSRGEAEGAAAAPISCHQRALRLLGARPHFRAELAAKLTARGYEADDVAAALDRLVASGYLDDAEAVRSFVAQRQERQGLGKARLRAELLRRGAPAAVVQEALAGVANEDDLERAREAAARWLLVRSPDRAALARHLDRRGFSRRAVLAVLAEGPRGSEGVEVEQEDEGAAEPAD